MRVVAPIRALAALALCLLGLSLFAMATAAPAAAQEEMTDAFCKEYLEDIGLGDAWPAPVGFCVMEWNRQQNIKACVVETAQTECWSCNFVNQFATTGLMAAAAAYDILSPGFISLIQYLFLVWIAIQALRMFMPDGNGLAVLQGVAIKSFLLVVVLFALTGGGMVAGDSMTGGSYSTFPFYRDWVLVPILDGGAELSIAIMNAFGAGGADFEAVFGTLAPMKPISSTLGADLEAVLGQLLVVIGKMQQINEWGFSMAVAMVGGFQLLDLEIAQLFAGLALGFFFGIALISYPFYVIDLLFRAVLLTVLAPVAVASVVFKPTRRVTIAAITGLVQSAATVAILGAVMSLVSALMSAALKMNQDYSSFAAWRCAVRHESAEITFGLDKPEFWFLACAGILSIGAISKARAIVGALISGFDDGKSMGDMAARLTSGAAQFVGNAAPGVVATSWALGRFGAGTMFGGGATAINAAASAAKSTGAAAASVLAKHLPSMKSGALASALTSAGMMSGNASSGPVVPGAAPEAPSGDGEGEP